MDIDRNLNIITKLVEIDKHTDEIKEHMKKVLESIKCITSEMSIIGGIYLSVLQDIKKDCDEKDINNQR